MTHMLDLRLAGARRLFVIWSPAEWHFTQDTIRTFDTAVRRCVTSASLPLDAGRAGNCMLGAFASHSGYPRGVLIMPAALRRPSAPVALRGHVLTYNAIRQFNSRPRGAPPEYTRWGATVVVLPAAMA